VSGWLGDGCMRRVSLRVVLLLGLLRGSMFADLGSGIGMAIEVPCMRMADCARAFDGILVVVRGTCEDRLVEDGCSRRTSPV
jgi:hypothetical protein